MELWVAKLCTLVLLLLITVTCGLLPLRLVTWLRGPVGTRYGKRTTNNLLSALNCFAGGVFIGTTFLHLMPEVNENMEDVIKEAGLKTEFPLGNFVILCGFFTIIIIEHVTMLLQHHAGHDHLDLDSSVSFEKQPMLGGRDDGGNSDVVSVVTARDPDTGSVSRPAGDCDAAASSGVVKYGSTDSGHSQMTALSKPEQAELEEEHMDTPRSRYSTIEGVPGDCVHLIKTTHHERHHQDGRQLQGIRSFVLLLALSLHTLFEGLALGLLNDPNGVWALFMAIAIHKAVLAFTLGVRFSEHMHSTCRVVTYMIIFSLMSPIGVAVGIGISESKQDLSTSVATAILQGVATGTFLHVTFFEVLHREVAQDHSLFKVLVVILGCAVIVLINLFM